MQLIKLTDTSEFSAATRENAIFCTLEA